MTEGLVSEMGGATGFIFYTSKLSHKPPLSPLLPSIPCCDIWCPVPLETSKPSALAAKHLHEFVLVLLLKVHQRDVALFKVDQVVDHIHTHRPNVRHALIGLD